MRPCLRASILAVSFSFAPCPLPRSAAASLVQWLPTVRLIGWRGVHRVDRRLGASEGERHLAPLDQGIAVELDWTIGSDAGPVTSARDGHMPADPTSDAWIGEVDLAPTVDGAGRLIDAFQPTSPPSPAAGRPTESIDVAAIRRRAAAVGRALLAISTARTSAERRRAELDLGEARARLRAHGSVGASGRGPR